jgi:hypothetical protein
MLTINESVGDDEINWFGGVAKSVTEMMTMPQKQKYNLAAKPSLHQRKSRYSDVQSKVRADILKPVSDCIYRKQAERAEIDK